MKLRWNRKGPNGTSAYVVEDDNVFTHVSKAQLDFIGHQRKSYKNKKRQAACEKKRSMVEFSRSGEQAPHYVIPDAAVAPGQVWKRINGASNVVRIDIVDGQLVLATYIEGAPQWVGKQLKFPASDFRPLKHKGWILVTDYEPTTQHDS